METINYNQKKAFIFKVNDKKLNDEEKLINQISLVTARILYANSMPAKIETAFGIIYDDIIKKRFTLKIELYYN
jgi:hypothetical protein